MVGCLGSEMFKNQWGFDDFRPKCVKNWGVFEHSVSDWWTGGLPNRVAKACPPAGPRGRQSTLWGSIFGWECAKTDGFLNIALRNRKVRMLKNPWGFNGFRAEMCKNQLVFDDCSKNPQDLTISGLKWSNPDGFLNIPDRWSRRAIVWLYLSKC